MQLKSKRKEIFLKTQVVVTSITLSTSSSQITKYIASPVFLFNSRILVALVKTPSVRIDKLVHIHNKRDNNI